MWNKIEGIQEAKSIEASVVKSEPHLTTASQGVTHWYRSLTAPPSWKKELCKLVDSVSTQALGPIGLF